VRHHEPEPEHAQAVIGVIHFGVRNGNWGGRVMGPPSDKIQASHSNVAITGA